MAITFNGTDDWLKLEVALATQPCVFSAWIRQPLSSDADYIFASGTEFSSDDMFRAEVNNIEQFRLNVKDTTNNIMATPGNPIGDDTWHHVFGWSNSSTDHGISLDGGTPVLSSTTAVVTPGTDMWIGANTTNSGQWNGEIAEFAIWNISIAGKEHAMAKALAGGAAPSHFYEGLVAYLPLIDNVLDVKGNVWTEVGTGGFPAFPHPTGIYYPKVPSQAASLPDPRLLMPELLIPNRKPIGPVVMDESNPFTQDMLFYGIVTPSGLHDVVNNDFYPLPNATIGIHTGEVCADYSATNGAVVTGSEEVVFTLYSAAPSAVGITIPADTTAMYVFGAVIPSTDGHAFVEASFSLSIDGAYDEFHEIPTDSNFRLAGCVAIWYNPTTGAQDLTVEMDSADEGPGFHAIYVKDGNTTAARDIDSASNITAADASVTLTTVSGDLVLSFAAQVDYSSTPPAALGGSWTSVLTGGQEAEARTSSIVATGATQVCPTDAINNIDLVVAVSIPADAGNVDTLTPKSGIEWLVNSTADGKYTSGCRASRNDVVNSRAAVVVFTNELTDKYQEISFSQTGGAGPFASYHKINGNQLLSLNTATHFPFFDEVLGHMSVSAFQDYSETDKMLLRSFDNGIFQEQAINTVSGGSDTTRVDTIEIGHSWNGIQNGDISISVIWRAKGFWTDAQHVEFNKNIFQVLKPA